jgi:hypothetical protein
VAPSRNRKPFLPKQVIRRERSERLEKRPVFSRILKIIKILAFLAIILGTLYVIFLTQIFSIQKVEVGGDAATLEEQNALNTGLQEYLGKNLLLINTQTLEKSLSEKYPYLKSISISRIPFHTLKVTLETYANAANVRVDFDNTQSKNFIINEQGYIVGTGTSLVDLPLIIMDTGSTSLDLGTDANPGTTLNQELIAKDTLDLLLESAESFEGKFNMQILEIHYLKQAREIHLLTERNFFVWLDFAQDIEKQLLKLKKSLSAINIYEADLDYIDLRISGQNGEKVIYMPR